MNSTLYRKYRPKKFDEISGEKEIVKTIINSLKNNNLSHAYLFSGPRGVGKTTTARLIAKGVNCLNPLENGEPCGKCKNCLAINEGNFQDLIEIDAASNRSIDEIRSIKEKINYYPVEGNKKIYIIDEAHMLTKEAFNALLKTLEEPPEHVIFILATTEIEKIIPTIISRCQRYDFKPLNLIDVKNKLSYIASNEEYTLDDEVYSIIYENSYGSMRDAISILERLIVTSSTKHISLEDANYILGITPKEKLSNFLENIKNNRVLDLNENLEDFWRNSLDLEIFFKDMAKFCVNEMQSNNLDIKIGYTIINVIYSSLSKFKFEDDKRLIGYVIVAELSKELFNSLNLNFKINNESDSQKKVNENNDKSEKLESSKQDKKLSKNEKIDTNDESKKISDKNKNKVTLTIERIKSTWDELLNVSFQENIGIKMYLSNAIPTKVDGDNIVISFKKSFAFGKEKMEEKDTGYQFLKIVRNFYNDDGLTVSYNFLDDEQQIPEFYNEFDKKIMDFFESK